MMTILGMPLDIALSKLADEGVSPVVAYTAGRHEAEDGEARVVRVSEDLRYLTAARFPTMDKQPEDDE